jgi:WhiB family redox-sensing transcriptional regulator
MPDLRRRWESEAACQGMPSALFFPKHGTKDDDEVQAATWAKPLLVCRHCPVRRECARDHLGEPEGVWGGMTPRQRTRYRKERSELLRQAPKSEQLTMAKMVMELREKYLWTDVARVLGLTTEACWYLEGFLKDQSHPVPAGAPGKRNIPVGRTTPQETIDQIIELRLAGTSQKEISRQLRVTPNTVRKYLMEHDETLVSPSAALVFPSQPPRWEDGWAKAAGRCSAAVYQGQTEDGAWILMKIHVNKGASTLGWFRKDDVKLTREITPVIVKRQGDRSRIYGDAS